MIRSVSRSYCRTLGLAFLSVVPALAQVNYERDVQPILNSSCVGCHQGAKPSAGLSLNSQDNLRRGGANGSPIKPGDSANSLLIQRVTATDKMALMPPGGKPLPPEQIGLLRRWIDESAATEPSIAKVDFAKDVQPILQANCYACHSGAQPKAQLRLDVGTLALKGGLSGPVIVPGHSDQSRLLHRVLGQNGEQRMPLRGTPLTATQTAVLKRWIDEGAQWPSDGKLEAKIEKHWAYVKPVRPALPAVKNSAWVRNPIDAFVLARLEKEGLTPSAEASKETLIRRVSLDLTGLPPTPAEIDAFLADKQPGAYERQVERLLASPHYGERWARPWLDLARYADTNGYEKDRRRTIWKYRDWVIQAFNRDLPFDQFTIEQLAGDMLPNATTEQKIATGFHRNSQYNEEGGVDKDEAMWEALIDRVNTTSTVWLGSTVGCSQCHNHKFDPFTQKEFYQMLAFFNNGDYIEKMNGDITPIYVEPQLDLPTAQQAEARKRLTAEIEALELKLKTHTPELAAEQAQWEQRLRNAPSAWQVLNGGTVKSAMNTPLAAQPDGSWLASGPNPSSDTYTIEVPVRNGSLSGLRLEALPDASLPRGGPGRDTYGNFAITDVDVTLVNGDKAQPLTFRLMKSDNGGVRDPKKSPQAPIWTVDASREDKRLPRQLVLALDTPVKLKSGATIRVTLKQASQYNGQGLGRFRLSATGAAVPEEIVGISAANRQLLSIAADQRTEAQRKQMADAYRAIAPSLQETRDLLTKLGKEKGLLGIDSSLVMAERAVHDRPSAPIRIRGSFLSPGEMVYANVPAVLPPLPESALPNRLGLARWIVSPENPLTSRVRVNQIWEQYFGRGIVETSEDFGSQGERPSHPELLDWLAVEFREKGWSQKALHRLIVTSAAYRQESTVTPQLKERDPYNRLLARGPRFRLEAEMVRDVALTASGLLSEKMGGPSVFPYQPEGVWDLPYNDEKWELSKGPDRYRRAVYTFVRRSAPYPSMVTFDAPSREFCTVRRVRTNTPLQALTTLNDSAFFEAAQSLARRTLQEGGTSLESRLQYAFRLCTGRLPKPEEQQALARGYEQELTNFQQKPMFARQVAGRDGTPEQAAWTMLSNVLLNLDETLTKE